MKLKFPVVALILVIACAAEAANALNMNDFIGDERAKAAALELSGGGRVTLFRLSYNRNAAEYEIGVAGESAAYVFVINAYTGKMNSFTRESALQTTQTITQRAINDRNQPGLYQPEAPDFANQVINLTNAERRKEGLHDLVIDNELAAAASLRAREIERKFEHTRPDGRSFATIISEFHVEPHNLRGENILYNTSDSPAYAVWQWMNSIGHRANILRREFTHIGVGVHRSARRTYVAQLFVGR